VRCEQQIALERILKPTHISYLKIPPDSLSNFPDMLYLMRATATIPYTAPPAFPDFTSLLVSAASITATTIIVVAYV
jgi:hypothetical protein